MKRRALMSALASVPLLLQAWPSHAAASKVQVYKNPSCGCCTAWIDHLKAAGFTVEAVDVDDTAPVRKRLGMPERLASCHTGIVDGYAIEGHVPAADIRRLLASKPKAVGLAVPGMPVGSPGMEVGGRKDRYQVILVDRDGRDSVFATYPARAG